VGFLYVLQCLAWTLMGVNLNMLLENPASCRPAPSGAKYKKHENTVDTIDTGCCWAQHVPGFGGGASIRSPTLVLLG